jgi:hypothetical protein
MSKFRVWTEEIDHAVLADLTPHSLIFLILEQGTPSSVRR